MLTKIFFFAIVSKEFSEHFTTFVGYMSALMKITEPSYHVITYFRLSLFRLAIYAGQRSMDEEASPLNKRRVYECVVLLRYFL